MFALVSASDSSICIIAKATLEVKCSGGHGLGNDRWQSSKAKTEEIQMSKSKCQRNVKAQMPNEAQRPNDKGQRREVLVFELLVLHRHCEQGTAIPVPGSSVGIASAD